MLETSETSTGMQSHIQLFALQQEMKASAAAGGFSCGPGQLLPVIDRETSVS